jgi:hypothetical protein
VIDVPSRTKTTELDLRPLNGLPGGEFPFWVAIRGNSTAFVTSERDREVVVVDISTPTPFVSNRIPLKGQPIRLILNKKQTRLYVAEGSSDAVAVIGAGSLNVLEEINTTAPPSVFDNRHGFKGSSPNSLALSQDETTLYVTNGGANSLAVIRLGNGAGETKVIGVIPTGWYPNSVSSDGSTLYVVNGKSNAGPNPQNCRDKGSLAIGHGVGPGAENACNAANQYVWQLTKAGFLTLPAPRGEELEDVTAQVAHNNAYRPEWNHDHDDPVLKALRSCLPQRPLQRQHAHLCAGGRRARRT